MFQYVFRTQQLPEHCRCLLNNRGVGNNVDHSPQTVFSGMSQGEGEGGHSLSPAGRYGEGKQSRRLGFPFLYTPF